MDKCSATISCFGVGSVINVNLFFTQVDIVVFNIISDILSQIVICRYYLKNKNEGFQLIDNQL